MSGPTPVIELAEPVPPAALREFRALMVGLSSHFEEKRPGYFDVNVPAERLGVEDGREEDWRRPFPLRTCRRPNTAPAIAVSTMCSGWSPGTRSSHDVAFGVCGAAFGMAGSVRCPS
ncbi:DUF6368 family protein [Streptomyces sp. NPDC052107]|uniref:DUF6368 family protein n=1 Tax=Streptomyces sp. NPDC052107 TaxID=3155632 RepID=UPI0034337571